MSSVVVFLSLPIFVTSVLQEVKVRSREDATLQCEGPRDAQITLLEWIRPELQSDGYVFFFQDQRSYENYQHEFFKGRVELRDPSMKDGDVSVILRNVSIRDTGTYECLITSSNIKGGENVLSEIKHSISLTVTASGFTDENTKERREKDGGDKDGKDKDGRNQDGRDKDGRNQDGGDKEKSFLVAVISGFLAVLLLGFIVTVAINIYRRKTSEKRGANCVGRFICE